MNDIPGIRRTVKPGLTDPDGPAELDEELTFHVEARTEDLVAEGLTPDEARAQALHELGDTARIRDEWQAIEKPWRAERRRARLFGSFRQDLIYGLRQLRKHPVFSLVAILTLGVGIGATTTVFSFTNAVVLRPFPFPDAHELVVVQETTPQGDPFSVAESNYLDWLERQRSFDALTAITGRTFNLTGDGDPAALDAMLATHSFPAVLGYEPALGRFFTPDEDRAGAAARVVVLGHRTWVDRYGAAPDVLGRSLVLDGESWTVVGVMPDGIDFADHTDVFVPLAPDAGGDRSNHELLVLGRLADGVDAETADGDLASIAAQLSSEYPDSNAGWGVLLRDFADWRVGADTRRGAWLVFGAVMLVMLMACANVSNLLIARASVREREMGIRSALGAGSGRLLHQLLVEGGLLALLGTAVGLFSTVAMLPLVRRFAGANLPRIQEVGIDGTVLGLAVLVTGFTAIVFGVVPGLHAVRKDVVDAIREGGSPKGSWGGRLRDALVVGEIGLAVVVLIGAGLMIRTTGNLTSVDLGFDPSDVTLVALDLPATRYDADARTQFYRGLEDRLGAIPGVVGVGANMSTPFAGFNASNFVAATESNPVESEDFLQIQWRVITPGYWDAMDIPLLRGRPLTWDDAPLGEEGTETQRYPVIINATLARALWPTGDAVGESITWQNMEGGLVVVGVVGDVRAIHLGADPSPMVYFPYAAMPWSSMNFAIETGAQASGVLAAVRAELADLDPMLAPLGSWPITDIIAEGVESTRFTMRLLGAFGVIALLMAAMGIYGVLTFAVTQRTREIGLRLALGADPSRLRRWILVHGARRVVLGLVVGLLAALAFTRAMTTLLYETTPTDTSTYAAVLVILAAVSLVASFLPAVRATRIDPRIAFTSD